MAYLGKTPSQAVRSRYYFTASGGETSISGTDDNGNTLTFTDGNYVDVYLNGVLLVAGTDYNTTTANTIGGLAALVASDVVEVVVYDTFSVFSGNVSSNFSVGGNLTVTGSATFDTDTLYVDSVNNRVGIGTSSPSRLLSLNAANASIDFSNGTWTNEIINSSGQMEFRADHTNAAASSMMSFSVDGSEAMRIDSSGGVIVGDTAPPSGAGGVVQFFLKQSSASNGIASVANANDAYVRILHDGSVGRLSTTYGTSAGYTPLVFDTGGAERMRIDTSGNLLVGKTSTTNSVAGVELNNTGQLVATFASGTHILGRNSTDGSILQFDKDGTTVGSIGVDSGDNLYLTGETGNTGGIYMNDAAVSPAYQGAERDAYYDLGKGAVRWKNIYLSGGVYLGGTAAANHLDDYEEGTWTPTPISLTTSGTVTYTGTYTKIGRFVFGLLTVISSGGTTTATADTTRFSGLPFTSDGINGMALSINTSTSGSTAAGQVSGTTLITGGWSAAGSVRMSFWYTST